MKKVLIDPGHGAHDPGGIGPTGKREKDFNLTMALKINALLKDNAHVKVTLTRSTDVFLELQERVAIANKLPADLFVSIHANAAGSTASGTETYYSRAGSLPAANVIHNRMVEATGFRDRGVKQAAFHVIKNTKMDAILLEVGFISHPAEEAQLFNETLQNKVAESVAQGICDYLGVPYKQVSSKPSKYPEMEITVHTNAGSKYTGYSIGNRTWIPSRPIGELLGGKIGYTKGKVTINGKKVETQNIDGVGYVTARDLTNELGARIFWDKSAPERVEIYPK